MNFTSVSRLFKLKGRNSKCLYKKNSLKMISLSFNLNFQNAKLNFKGCNGNRLTFFHVTFCIKGHHDRTFSEHLNCNRLNCNRTNEQKK